MQPADLVHRACLECKLQMYLIHRALGETFRPLISNRAKKVKIKVRTAPWLRAAPHRAVPGPRRWRTHSQNPGKAPHPTHWPAVLLHPMVCLCLKSSQLAMVNSIQEASL